MERCTLEKNGFVGIYFPGKNYPEECEKARQDSFKRILRFLREWD